MAKGRPLWRPGGSCPYDREYYDHDHVFDDRTRGGDYAADDRDDHDDDFVFDDGVDHHDQF